MVDTDLSLIHSFILYMIYHWDPMSWLSENELTFVVGGLFQLLSRVKVPVMRLRIPSLGPELNGVRVGHHGVGLPALACIKGERMCENPSLVSRHVS